MDVEKREKVYKELDNLLLKIKDCDERHRKIFSALFLKKFEALCREFDLWLAEEMRRLDKRIEEYINKTERRMQNDLLSFQ